MIKGHFLIWVVLIVLTFFGSPLFETPQEAMQRAVRDTERITHFFGGEKGRSVAEVADKMYASSALPILKGIVKHFYFQKDQNAAEKIDGGKTGEAMAVQTNAYFDTLMIAAYPMVLRALSCVLICLYVIPFLLAAVVDGVMTLKVRGDMAYANPNRYHLSLHGVLAAFAFPVLYSIAPWLEISPNWFFLWVFFLVASINLAIANFPPSARG